MEQSIEVISSTCLQELELKAALFGAKTISCYLILIFTD